MGVNRFMSPVKTQYIQTAVDQHVPMPFELMQKRAESEQKHFDDNKANWEAIKQKMGEDYLTLDDPSQKFAIEELTGRVDKAIADYDGDWRQADNVLRNVANEYNTYAKTGVGALSKSNKMTSDASHKAVAESNMTSENKDLFGAYDEWKYAQTGGAANGGVYKGTAPGSINEKLTGDILTAFRDIHKSGNQTAHVDSDGQFIITSQEGWEGVDKTAFQKQVRGLVNQDSAWLDMTQKEFDIKSEMGLLNDPDMTIEEYQKAIINKQFMGMAEGREWKDHDAKKTAKELKSYADKKDFYRNNPQGLSLFSTKRMPGNKENAENNKAIIKVKDSEAVSVIRGQQQGLIDGVFDYVKSQANASDPNTPFVVKEGIESIINIGDKEYDINNSEDKYEIVKGLADNTMSMTDGIRGMFGSLSDEAIKQKANQAMEQYEAIEQRRIDALERLLKSGDREVSKDYLLGEINRFEASKRAKSQNKAILTHKEFYTKPTVDYAQAKQNYIDAQEKIARLKREARSKGGTQAYDYGQKTANQLKYLNDSMFTFESTMKALEKSGDIPEEYIQAVSELRSLSGVHDHTEKINEKVGKELKAMATWEQNAYVAESSGPLSPEQVKLVGSDTDKEDVINTLNKSIIAANSKYLGATVTDLLGERVTLEEAFGTEALRQGYKKGSKEYNAYVNQKKADVTKVQPAFNNSLTNNGELATNVLGYDIEFGSQPGQVNVPGLKEHLTSKTYNKFWVNGEVKQAFYKGGDNYKVKGMEGVYIRTDKSGSTAAEAETSDYNLILKPSFFGIDSHRNSVIPREHVKEFLGNVKSYEQLASKLGKIPVKENGVTKYVSLEQAKFMLVEETLNKK